MTDEATTPTETESAVATQEGGHSGPDGHPSAAEPLFEEDELTQFDADDVTAGRAICKMLSLFFLYTVIVMAIAGYWTVRAVMN